MDLAEEIGVDFEIFGTLLLEDKTGNKVRIIIVSKHYDPVEDPEAVATRKRKKASYMADIGQMLARHETACSCR